MSRKRNENKVRKKQIRYYGTNKFMPTEERIVKNLISVITARKCHQFREKYPTNRGRKFT